MPLVRFQHPHRDFPQESPYSGRYEDYDPTFDPNFDEDTIYDGSLSILIICLPIDRAPAQNHHTQRYDLPWRILTIQKCLVRASNSLPPTTTTNEMVK